MFLFFPPDLWKSNLKLLTFQKITQVSNTKATMGLNNALKKDCFMPYFVYSMSDTFLTIAETIVQEKMSINLMP